MKDSGDVKLEGFSAGWLRAYSRFALRRQFCNGYISTLSAVGKWNFPQCTERKRNDQQGFANGGVLVVGFQFPAIRKFGHPAAAFVASSCRRFRVLLCV